MLSCTPQHLARRRAEDPRPFPRSQSSEPAPVACYLPVMSSMFEVPVTDQANLAREGRSGAKKTRHSWVNLALSREVVSRRAGEVASILKETLRILVPLYEAIPRALEFYRRMVAIGTPSTNRDATIHERLPLVRTDAALVTFEPRLERPF